MLVVSMSNQENTCVSPSHCLLGPSERRPLHSSTTPLDMLIAAGASLQRQPHGSHRNQDFGFVKVVVRRGRKKIENLLWKLQKQ